MQQQFMPFGWPTLNYFPLPPTIEDNDLFINSVVNGGSGTPGPAGVGVANAEVTDNPGDLLITLTDGTIINAGNVIGPQGPQGPQGPSGGSCSINTKTIYESYTAQLKDFYIGAELEDEATVYLPKDPPDGTEYVIKLQYGAPVGNRKLTIKPTGTSLINGTSSSTMTTPYQSINIISNDNNWWTV